MGRRKRFVLLETEGHSERTVATGDSLEEIAEKVQAKVGPGALRLPGQSSDDWEGLL